MRSCQEKVSILRRGAKWWEEKIESERKLYFREREAVFMYSGM
uniref:Uncharacterized protein n=1 Tax=Anguilla anguilla TaxID=7936 RepID=A0A0E9UYU7_ANGAN